MSTLEYISSLAPESPEWVHQQIAEEIDKRDAEIAALKAEPLKFVWLPMNQETKEFDTSTEPLDDGEEFPALIPGWKWEKCQITPCH